jgi:hypothetical protein
MRIQTLIVDDFYKNPDEVRKFALSQEFKVRGNYPGQRTDSFLTNPLKEKFQELVRPFAGEIVWWGDHSTGSFQYTVAADRSWIHSDTTTDWAGVIYLTPDAPLSAGTGLFKHKETGVREWDRKKDYGMEQREHASFQESQDYTKWEMADRLGNVYNRLVLYRGGLYHVSLDYFGKDMHDGRLFQVFFFNTEK